MDTNAVEKIMDATEVAIEEAPKMIEVAKAVKIAVTTFVAGVVAGAGGTIIAKKIRKPKNVEVIEKVKEDVKELSEDAEKILGEE